MEIRDKRLMPGGYYITVDELQYILRQEYPGVNKEGDKTKCVRTVSYHRTLEQAVEKYLKLVETSLQPDKAVTLREYVKMLKQENKRVVKAIEGRLVAKE